MDLSQASPSQESPSNANPASESSSSGSFNWRGYVNTAEKTATDLNSQFTNVCHKLTGEKDAKAEEATKDSAKEEPSIMSSMSDFGNKGYGLFNMLEKKLESGKTDAPK